MAIPVAVTLGASLLAGLLGKRKKNKETDAYNKAQTDYLNTQGQYDTDAANAEAAAAERSRVAKEQLKAALLKTMSPNTIDPNMAMAAIQSNSAYNPIVRKRAAAPYAPKASTGMIWDALSGVLGSVAGAQVEKQQAKDFWSEYDKRRLGKVSNGGYGIDLDPSELNPFG